MASAAVGVAAAGGGELSGLWIAATNIYVAICVRARAASTSVCVCVCCVLRDDARTPYGPYRDDDGVGGGICGERDDSTRRFAQSTQAARGRWGDG